jgi:hypothetical protein
MNNSNTSLPSRPRRIKCISLWQPWASLIALGEKKIETRHWATPYRGPLAIHAAKRWTGAEAETCLDSPFWEILSEAGLIEQDHLKPGRAKPTERMPLGAIVAVVDLTDCVPTFQKGALAECWLSSSISIQERHFGNYAANRFGWMLSKVRALPEPIPYKGEQGLFEIDASILPQTMWQ